MGKFLNMCGRVLGRAVEGWGKFVGSEKIQRVGRKIYEECSDKVATDVGDEEEYYKESSNIHSTERLSNILVSFSEDYREYAEEVEDACIKEVEEYYDQLIEIIENAPSVSHSEANLRELKKGKRKISRTIKGGITTPLSKRMSLDDSECLRILKISSGSEKKKAMKKFAKKVMKEALKNLSKNVRTALNEQGEDIEEYLVGIVEEQEKAARELKEAFDKMIEDDGLEQSDKEKNCVNPLYVIDATESIVQILG